MSAGRAGAAAAGCAARRVGRGPRRTRARRRPRRRGWAAGARRSRTHHAVVATCQYGGMTVTAGSVRLGDVRAARELIRDVVRRTPLENSRPLADRVGGPVHLKCENLQRTGSFKIRGAYVRIAGLSEEEKARGVVAASAGNHAQGVALAASLLGTTATVFMPDGAPLPKMAATRSYGAEVRLTGRHTVEGCLSAAVEFAAATGATLIHPFDHPDIVAGQGTVGLEILEQCPGAKT